METLSAGVLVFFGIILFENYAAGTLGNWLKAKFLNITPNASTVASTSVFITGAS